jgi:hypothetical protein
MNRFLIAPLMVAAALIIAGDEVLAQNAFPAPLPGQAAQPPANGSTPSAPVVDSPASSFPSSGAPPIAAAPPSGASGECANGYTSLREDAERKGKLIAAARERRAPPDETCKLISEYGAAEVKLIKYVETNTARCAIPAQFAQQLNADHKKTANLQTKVCTLAQQQMRKRAPAGPTGDFWPATTDAPI